MTPRQYIRGRIVPDPPERPTARQLVAALPEPSAESLQLDRKAKDYAAEHDLDYVTALDKVMETWSPETGEPVHELDITYAELEANHRLLDKTLRAISLAKDLDYLGAITALEEWAASAAVTGPPGDVKLSRVFDAGAMTLASVRADVDRFTLAEQEVDDKIELAAAGGDGEETDAHGNVRFPESADLAKLVTDDAEVERAYQRVLAVDPDHVGDLDAFREEHTRHTRLGIDLAATLERNQREDEAAVARRIAEQNQATAEDRERVKRAEKRKAQRQIDNLRSRL